ncbi:MAG: hypothetical protein ACE5IR_13735 [bacterium]
MKYLLDTVTLVRHFAGTGHIGPKALEILNKFDNQLFQVKKHLIKLKALNQFGINILIYSPRAKPSGHPFRVIEPGIASPQIGPAV